MSVVVFGSINMDLVVRTPRHPRPGETLIGHTSFTASGGKGANQAVASARLGARTRLIGRVGDDFFGTVLRDALSNDGVDISGVITDPQQPSGNAMIAVDDAAENTIIVVLGANGAVNVDDVGRLGDALDDAAVLLLQLEVPMDMVVAAAQAAQARGVMVIVDPAPAQPLPAELYAVTDILTPNEHEASLLVGFNLVDQAAIERAGRKLLDRGARNVVIKLGAKGAYWTNGTDQRFMPPFEVDAIDTVAAGDAFNGGLAAAVDDGLDLIEALQWGMATGALSVTRAGAQPSLPVRSEVLQLLSQQRL